MSKKNRRLVLAESHAELIFFFDKKQPITRETSFTFMTIVSTGAGSVAYQFKTIMIMVF